MISKSHYPSGQNYSFTSNKSYFNTKFSQVGAIAEANVVYKKVDGAWVQKTDIQSMLSYLQNNNIRSM